MSSTGSGYDLGCNIFSPDGRVFQVEYANKAVESAGAAVGLKCKDGVVMGVEKLLLSKLLVPGTNKRIHTVSNTAGIATAGYTADGRLVAGYAQDISTNFRRAYGVGAPPHALADQLGQVMHSFTQYGGARPLGVMALVAGYDERDKQAYLHMVEPSGMTFRYRGCSVGKSRQAAKTEIERLDLAELTVREGLREIARIILTLHDDVKDKPFEFEASWVCEDSGFEHVEVPKELRDEAITWAKAKIEEMDDDDDDDSDGMED